MCLYNLLIYELIQVQPPLCMYCFRFGPTILCAFVRYCSLYRFHLSQDVLEQIPTVLLHSLDNLGLPTI